MAIASRAFGTAFVFTYVVAVGSLLVFSWLRNFAPTRRFYSPKRFDTNQAVKPVRLPSGWILWIWHLIWVPEDQVITVAGLDSAVYLRVLRMSWEIFVWVGIWCLVVVLPVNLSGGIVDKIVSSAPPPPSPPVPDDGCSQITTKTMETDLSEFDKCSLTNIGYESSLLWAHVVSSYVVTGIVLRIIWRYNKEMTVLRILFLANAPKGGPSHTALVQDIPGIAYGTVPWKIMKILNGTFLSVLPESWRNKLIQFVKNIIFKGVVGSWGKFKEVASKATDEVAAVATSTTPSKRADSLQEYDIKASLEIKPSSEKHKLSPSKEAYGTSTSINSGVPNPKRSERPAAASESAPPDAASPIPEDEAFVRAQALRMDIVVDPPEVDKVNVADVNSRSMDVWAIATDYLEATPGDGTPAPTFHDMIEDEFKYVYGKHAVATVNPVWDQSELDPLIGEFNNVKTDLEDYLDWAAVGIRRRKIPKPKMLRIVPMVYGSWGAMHFGVRPVSVEALRFWPMRLQYLAEEIEEAKTRAEGVRVTPSAFVTFNSRVAQVIATSTLHQHVESMWRVVPAPDPKEVLWSNVKMRAWERVLRTLVHWSLYFLILCFYMVPVTAVQGLIAIPSLTSSTAASHPAISSLIESILPGLVLKGIMWFMPFVFDIMCRYTGFISESEVDFGVVSRFFIFQVIALFIGSLISGSFLNQIKTIVKYPSAIIRIMAASVPQTSTFFINYTLIAGVTIYSVVFLRPISLAIFFFRSHIMSTPRQRIRLWADQYKTYGHDLPNNMIIYLFGLVFCIINPIMCLVVFTYFSFIIIFERYNALFIYKNKYESGGRIWSIVFHQMMTALYVMQVTVLVVISLKKFPPAAFIFPVIVITAMFHVTCAAMFTRPWNVLSLRDASYLDYEDRKSRGSEIENLTEAEKSAIREMYLSPAFKRSAHEIDDLLIEAEKVQRLIAGESIESVLQDFVARGLIEVVDGKQDGEDGEDESSQADEHDAPIPSPKCAAGGDGAGTGPHKSTCSFRSSKSQRHVRFSRDVEAGDVAGSKARAGSEQEAAPSPKRGSWWGWGWSGRKQQASAASDGARASAAQGSRYSSTSPKTDSTAAVALALGGSSHTAPVIRDPTPETALALVSALADQLCSMDTASRQQFQAMLRGNAAAPASGGGSRQ